MVSLNSTGEIATACAPSESMWLAVYAAIVLNWNCLNTERKKTRTTQLLASVLECTTRVSSCIWHTINKLNPWRIAHTHASHGLYASLSVGPKPA